MNKLLSLTAVGLLSVSAIAFAAQAGETDYTGLMGCGHVKMTMLTTGPEVTTYTDEMWGIVPPGNPVKELQNATFHCVGYNKLMQGQTERAHFGACYWTDASGDTLLGENVEAPGKPPVWTFLSGTGKWKGIGGSGTYQGVSIGKPGPDGAFEACIAMSGKWTLPK